MKKIVVIGGGTGTYTVLRGLVRFPVSLSVIVTMTDSGGSNRVIRDEFGLLPTSDLRQCIVALADEEQNETLRQLFTYRYSNGTGIAGMTFGNLFMAALTDIYKSQEEAIEKTCELLNVKGDIIPVTFDNVHLVAKYDNGKEVLGEHQIDEPGKEFGNHRITKLKVFPKAKLNKKALKAIREADLIVMGPGDLYTSIISNLVVDGVGKAVSKSKAKRVYVMNLMTKFGQTDGFTGRDFISELEKYTALNSIDVCLVNKSKPFSKQILNYYKEEKAMPVIDNLKATRQFKVVRKEFVSTIRNEKHSADKLKRSLIRHDSDKLARAIFELL